MTALPVSVVISVKNEEKNLPSCLESVRQFPERIVVDSGSTDATPEIARAAGATLIQFHWDGKFPKKRNWVLRTHQFSQPWVLFLDADEKVTPEFVEALTRVLPGTKHDGFWLTYQNHFMGRLLRYGDKFRKIALLRVGKGEYERIDENAWSKLDMEVHEHPIVEGTVGTIHAPIVHEDFKGLYIYARTHNEYSEWESRRFLRDIDGKKKSDLNFRQRMKYKLGQSIWIGPIYFFYSYICKLGFLDGQEGLAFAIFKMSYFTQIAGKIREYRAKEEAEKSVAKEENPVPLRANG